MGVHPWPPNSASIPTRFCITVLLLKTRVRTTARCVDAYPHHSEARREKRTMVSSHLKFKCQLLSDGQISDIWP